MMNRTILLALASSCLVLGSALAAPLTNKDKNKENSKQQDDCCCDPKHPAAPNKFDKNGDGKLSEAEKRAKKEAEEARRKAMLAKYDTNHNGKIDPNERPVNLVYQALIKRFDKDRDGKLNEAERATLQEAMKAYHQSVLATYDLNRDGELDDGEGRTYHRAMLAKYDTNKDGKISDEERVGAINDGWLPFPPKPKHCDCGCYDKAKGHEECGCHDEGKGHEHDGKGHEHGTGDGNGQEKPDKDGSDRTEEEVGVEGL